jgi:hypothetical protein
MLGEFNERSSSLDHHPKDTQLKRFNIHAKELALNLFFFQ